MTWDELSDGSKLLFMIWGLGLFRPGLRGMVAAEWRRATGLDHEDLLFARAEVESFLNHCAECARAVDDQRRKDKERMKRQ